jgi:8-oxo-dGTP diphosphatase
MRRPRDTVTVVAAVVEQNGCFLLTRRLEGTHLAGRWEFPGGKCNAGEEHAECLRRELREELDVSARIDRLILSTMHEYSDRTVALHFYEASLHSEPKPQLGQEMRWARREELSSLDFPEADAELIQMLLDDGRQGATCDRA